MKIFVHSVIADIFTVGDTAIIILSAFAAVRSADLCPHDVEDDVDLRRVYITVTDLYFRTFNSMITLCRSKTF